LTAANFCVYNEKAKHHQAVQSLIEEGQLAESVLQNYIDRLEDENDDLHSELKATLTKKHASV